MASLPLLAFQHHVGRCGRRQGEGGCRAAAPRNLKAAASPPKRRPGAALPSALARQPPSPTTSPSPDIPASSSAQTPWSIYVSSAPARWR
jgi:hypothetical protein